MSLLISTFHFTLTTLSPLSLLPILVFVIVFFFFFFFLALFFQKLRDDNEYNHHGPPTYPILGCLLSFNKNRRRLLGWYTELLASSPSQTIVICRLGARRTIITANPDNVQYILKTNFSNFPKGPPFTDILGDLLGRGIFNVDGELWLFQRKLASHEFSAKSIREPLFKTLETEASERLLPMLESASEKGDIADLQELLRRFAFDVVCKVSLGLDPRCLEPLLPVSSLLQAFDVAAEISALRATAPISAVWKVKRLLRIGSERRLREAVKYVHILVMELIRQKRMIHERQLGGEIVSNDLLSRLISGGHDDEVIRDMVISFVMAGRDTTSAALTWLFWLLSRHPDVERRLVASTTMMVDNKKPLNYESLKYMGLLEACICEAMRLYPPVAWDSKHAVSDDRLPDGTLIGRGDRVTYFPYGMGRLESVWGKDSLEFRPERWLELPPTKVSPYKFPVFQGGPRVCIGKEMAFVQMKYVAASILQKFQLRPVMKEEPVFVPLLTAHMAGGFKVLFTKRDVL